MKRAALLLTILAFVGCTKTVNFVQFDTGQIIQGEYQRASRIITVTMPDGQILSGPVSRVSNATFTFSNAFASGSTVATGSAFGGGQAYTGTATASSFGSGFGYGITGGGRAQGYAIMKSQTSTLMMELIAVYSEWTGEGFGEARTNDGRVFKVQF